MKKYTALLLAFIFISGMFLTSNFVKGTEPKMETVGSEQYDKGFRYNTHGYSNVWQVNEETTADKLPKTSEKNYGNGEKMPISLLIKQHLYLVSNASTQRVTLAK